MYPGWVEKYHTKGTSVKRINNTYYLYSVTSKRVKDKKYPVTTQKYIGKITEEGLIEAEKIVFFPGVDRIMSLGDETKVLNTSDKEILNKIYVIKNGENFCCGKLTNKEIQVIKKYYKYENGKIWR